jgi:hypothetical protein
MMSKFRTLCSGLELVLERQLDNARIVGRRCDHSKARRTHSVIWIAEIRRVGEVEEFRSCTNALRLRNWNRALECQVKITLSRATHDADATITEARIGRSGSEGRFRSGCKCGRAQVSAQNAGICRSGCVWSRSR